MTCRWFLISYDHLGLPGRKHPLTICQICSFLRAVRLVGGWGEEGGGRGGGGGGGRGGGGAAKQHVRGSARLFRCRDAVRDISVVNCSVEFKGTVSRYFSAPHLQDLGLSKHLLMTNLGIRIISVLYSR